MLSNKLKLLIILIPICLIVIFVCLLNTDNPFSKFVKKLFITSVPTTSVPTTSVPTTSVPTTSVPTTSVPTTSVPTTSVPTTSVPTASVPTTSVPTTSVPTTSVPTTSVPVPIDCRVSDWIANNNCSVNCGGGTQNFSRSILINPSNGGKICPVDLKKSNFCNTHPCPVNCQVSEWGPCKCLSNTQERTILKNPSHGGTNCPYLSQTCSSEDSSKSCNDWYYFNNTYISDNEYSNRSYTDSFKNCYSKCDNDNSCAAVYAYNGPEIPKTSDGKQQIECSLVKADKVNFLISRHGSMTPFNPNNRQAYVNKKKLDEYDPRIFKTTYGGNILEKISTMVTPNSVA
jgi:hypothetical protein